MNHCPYCNSPLKKSYTRRAITAYAGYKRHHVSEFEANAITPWEPTPPQAGGYFEATRQRPARPMNIESDFITPILQSIGVFCFLTMGGLYLSWQFDFAWHVACFLGLLGSGLAYAGILAANRKLLWIAESIITEPVEVDGHEPQRLPPPTPIPLEVVINNDQGVFQRMFRFELPEGITEADFLEFAKGAEIRGLAESAWTGKNKPFSKPAYGQLLNLLDEAGIIRWVNPKSHAQGRVVTDQGRKTLRRFALTHAQAITN